MHIAVDVDVVVVTVLVVVVVSRDETCQLSDVARELIGDPAVVKPRHK